MPKKSSARDRKNKTPGSSTVEVEEVEDGLAEMEISERKKGWGDDDWKEFGAWLTITVGDHLEVDPIELLQLAAGGNLGEIRGMMEGMRKMLKEMEEKNTMAAGMMRGMRARLKEAQKDVELEQRRWNQECIRADSEKSRADGLAAEVAELKKQCAKLIAEKDVLAKQIAVDPERKESKAWKREAEKWEGKYKSMDDRMGNLMCDWKRELEELHKGDIGCATAQES